MIVEFHGVRGSIPMPSSSTIKYGGHTSCYEVVTDKYQFIFDAGTGFQSVKLMEDRTVVIIFTHFIPIGPFPNTCFLVKTYPRFGRKGQVIEFVFGNERLVRNYG